MKASRFLVRFSVSISLLAISASCAGRTPKDSNLSTESTHFISIKKIAPNVDVEMRYYSSHNFVGRPIVGYKKPVCLLTREAAFALSRVQKDLEQTGLGLRVYDCYRPQKAVNDFVSWSKEPSKSIEEQKAKAEFYPEVDKSKVFELGYVATQSGHTRGSTVDLTLIDTKNGGAPLDMGTPYDFLSERSSTANASITGDARKNRDRLKAAMLKENFVNYEKEWWHYTLHDEPYSNIYFDFDVTDK